MNIFQRFFKEFQVWLDVFIERTPNIILSFVVFFVSIYVSRFVRKIVIRILESRKIKRSARNMLGNIVSIIVVFLGIILALNILELDDILKTILTGAGVAGLVIGLALQGTLSNTFSGVALSFFKDLKLGDQVETNGFIGEIEDINLRVVKLRTLDYNMVSIPNSLIIGNPLKNFSESTETKISVICGVGYESDLQKVKELTIAAGLEKIPTIFPESVTLFFTEFADSSINYQLRFIAPATNISEIAFLKSEAIMAIKNSYDKNGINIPFPIRTVYMNKPALCIRF